VVEHDLAKVVMRVRFPSLAPSYLLNLASARFFLFLGVNEKDFPCEKGSSKIKAMKYSIFSYMQWINPKNIGSSPEQFFFDRNAQLFTGSLAVFNDASSIFGIIRSDIVLAGLKNKKDMDEQIDLYSVDQLKVPSVIASLHEELPFLDDQGTKIYIPSYSPTTNQRYESGLSLFKSFPYNALLKDPQASVVDPFETYGNRLFGSPFTRLVELETHDVDSNAFFHPAFNTLFIIDNYGGLEAEIPLFDEKMKMKDGDGLIGRLELLVKAYYSNNRDDFVNSLGSLRLVSKTLYTELTEITDKADNRRNKRLRS
jgi:hypothetical protein